MFDSELADELSPFFSTNAVRQPQLQNQLMDETSHHASPKCFSHHFSTSSKNLSVDMFISVVFQRILLQQSEPCLSCLSSFGSLVGFRLRKLWDPRNMRCQVRKFHVLRCPGAPHGRWESRNVCTKFTIWGWNVTQPCAVYICMYNYVYIFISYITYYESYMG